MTQQLDAFGLPLDEATTLRIGLPQAREVRKRRLPDVLRNPKPIHRAKFIRADGRVSPLCAAKPRAIDLRRSSWTNRDEAVTCPGCLKLIGERAAIGAK